uniref:Uncharacterized protein n=1 Tax=Avena sativa TaxID=4498 RepID=A0ACD6A4C6_AVESA
MLLRKTLEKHFESSSFNIGSSSSATPEVTDCSLPSSTKAEDLSSSQQDVFLLPSRAHDNSTQFEYGTYSSMLGMLRDQVMSASLLPFLLYLLLGKLDLLHILTNLVV